MTSLFEPVVFAHGGKMTNRFALAPLTNWQSNEDGTLSDAEYNWLVKRAKAGFGMTMTCAAHVQESGKGFEGQLGVFSDDLLPGLKRLADGIHEGGGLAIAQLYHGGMRSDQALTGVQPVSASDQPKYNARAMTTEEIDQLIEDFILAAIRCEKAGFDGVEIHGAHGYLLCQILSPGLNSRDDKYGGSLANRARPILDIIDGIRERVRPDFNLSLRLSPERFGMEIAEILELTQTIMNDGKLDFIDMSLWDCFMEPVDPEYKGKRLIDWFAGLKRGNTKLCVAGKIMTAADANEAMNAGADMVMAGRAAILHHDFVEKVQSDPSFQSMSLPATREHLKNEALSDFFIDKIAETWKEFVA